MTLLQSAIITGSNGLLGRYLSRALEQDYNLHLVDIDDVDLSREEEVQEYMAANTSPILVNLFAINHHVAHANTSQGLVPQGPSFADYLNINVRALHDVCIHFIRSRPNGVIVNLSSVYGLVSPNPSIYPHNQKKDIGYSVSKTAVIGLSGYLAAHYAPCFRVNTLAIGGVLDNQPSEFVRSYSELTPMKRMMNIHEILEPLKFLMSLDNTYMTGSVLTVDGGYSIV